MLLSKLSLKWLPLHIESQLWICSDPAFVVLLSLLSVFCSVIAALKNHFVLRFWSKHCVSFRKVLFKWLIAIATLGDWIKGLAPVFQPMASKIKTSDFSRAFRLSKLQAIARTSDWYIALFTPVLIGWSSYHGIGFPTVIWKHFFDIQQLMKRLTKQSEWRTTWAKPTTWYQK